MGMNVRAYLVCQARKACGYYRSNPHQGTALLWLSLEAGVLCRAGFTIAGCPPPPQRARGWVQNMVVEGAPLAHPWQTTWVKTPSMKGTPVRTSWVWANALNWSTLGPKADRVIEEDDYHLD